MKQLFPRDDLKDDISQQPSRTVTDAANRVPVRDRAGFEGWYCRSTAPVDIRQSLAKSIWRNHQALSAVMTDKGPHTSHRPSVLDKVNLIGSDTYQTVCAADIEPFPFKGLINRKMDHLCLVGGMSAQAESALRTNLTGDTVVGCCHQRIDTAKSLDRTRGHATSGQNSETDQQEVEA
jgi:hypothetical protein